MKVTIQVAIGDLKLRNSEIDRLEVVQELGQHTTCRIEFIRDSSMDVTLDELLRDPITVTVKGEGAPILELFQGSITDGSQSHLLNLGSRFSLEAVSPSESLDYTDTVYFPQSTLASIAGKFGVRVVGSPRRDPGPFDHVQWGESEFDFLKRLGDEHGFFLVTSGAQAELRNEFQDKGWELLWGDTLLEVSARAKPVNHGYSGVSYELGKKHIHVHAGIRQNAPSLGGAAKLVNAVADLARQASNGGDPGLEEPIGRALTHADYKALLRQESERTLGGAVLVEGQSVKPGITAGDLVELIQGTSFVLPTTGKLGLIKVVHLFDDQHYRNRFVATPWKQFVGLERPPAPTRPGPVCGIVVETAGDPLKMGRIKVAYQWQTESSTNWARFAAPHAGNGRGVLFLPEVGDEVLIAFEAGDAERPIIIGSLWNGKDQAPPPEKENTAKRIITRSGNTIQLLDDKGEETIEILTPKAKCIVQLTNKGSQPVITIRSEGDIAFEAKNEIRFKCKKMVQDIEVDSIRKVGADDSVEAGKNVTVKAGMDLGLSGLNAILKGGMNVESVAGAINNVVGSMVHIQPPGFMGKSVSAKSASVPAFDPGSRETPVDGGVQRTADAPTPR